MDILYNEDRFRHLGFFSIFKESYKVIFSRWKRIFFHINLVFVFPLALLLVANLFLSTYLNAKIADREVDFNGTGSYSPRYDILKHKIVREWILFVLLNIAYFLIVLICLSLFAIAAVTVTVACIYSAKEITLKKVINFVPKAWKRLVATYLCYFFIWLFYNVVVMVQLVVSIVLVKSSNQVLGITLTIIVGIVYIIGALYIDVIWNMASVVAVVEDIAGLGAMKKGWALVKGNLLLNVAIYIVFRVCMVGIQIGIYFAVTGGISPAVINIVIGIATLFAITKLTLLSLVAQAILYLVCKAFHNESVDKAFLNDQLIG